jgi:hypothetical protein
VIVVAARWYLRFNLSYRDVEELLVERGVEVDHVTVFRWVQRFLRHEVAVRREAPSLTGRGERTRHRLVAAGRLKLGAVRPWRRTVRAASGPDNAGTHRYCQTVWVRQA